MAVPTRARRYAPPPKPQSEPLHKKAAKDRSVAKPLMTGGNGCSIHIIGETVPCPVNTADKTDPTVYARLLYQYYPNHFDQSQAVVLLPGWSV